MRWLFICGISLDFAGAVLIGWTIYRRTAAETREEALTRFDANLWIVAFRLREQSYVRAGLALLSIGFALQWAGYVTGLGTRDALVAAVASVALIGGALVLAGRFAHALVPVEYVERQNSLIAIEDERHSFNLPSLEAVTWWRRNWVERIARRPLEIRTTRVQPRVNHGRWLFDCPDCRAKGTPASSNATPGLDTVVCLTCGGEFPASFPAERAEIERLLLLRPSKEHRNWETAEPVDDLRAENVAHGFADSKRPARQL
jgi:hypothetical protein